MKLEKGVEQHYAAALRENGYLVLHPDDFTIENFHHDAYFRAAVEAVMRWWMSPEPPKLNPEMVQRLLSSPLADPTVFTDPPAEEEA